MSTATAPGSKKSEQKRQVRVLLAKTGLDGHDRGMKVVAMFLRDAGMDVVYLGIHSTTETIVRAAIDEDVDVIGLSSLGGTHLAHSRALLDQLRKEGMANLPVVVGGTIPVEDLPALEKLGVRAVLRPGTQRDEIVSIVETLGLAAKKTQT